MVKLISCYITGFGKLENYAYTFQEGLNTVFEENGWGKSTFCAFLKAMFYGLEYKARSKSLTERKHYRPWNGGVYGGNLILEIEEKRYRIERTFGSKDKDDTFRLIDVTTETESDDYSENIGEEIFEVDREGFEKSVFLPQDKLVTSMTDSLNAKIGDLAAAKDDMSNFDAAIARIEDAKRLYSSRGAVNPGKLQMIAQEMSVCREAVETLPVKMEAYTLKRSLVKEKNKRLQALRLERTLIGEEIAEQSKREQELGTLKAKRQQLAQQQEKLSALDDFFAGGIPEEQEILKAREREEALLNIGGRLETVEASLPNATEEGRLNELFRDYEISDEQFSFWEETADRIRELRLQSEHNQMPEEEKEKLKDLRYYFSGKVPTEEELNDIGEKVKNLHQMDGEIDARETRYHALTVEKEAREKHNTDTQKYTGGMWLFFGLTVICAVGAYLFKFLFSDELSDLFAMVFAIGAAISLAVMLNQLINMVRAKRGITHDEEEELLLAEKELEESRAAREAIKNECKEFLSGYLVTPTDSMQQMVTEIQSKAVLYRQLLEEEDAFTESNSKCLEELSEKQITLNTALAHYATVYNIDLYQDGSETELLLDLRRDFRSYREYRENKKQETELLAQKKELTEALDAFLSRFPEAETEELRLNAIAHRLRSYKQLQEEVDRLSEELKDFKELEGIPEDVVSVRDLQQKQHEIERESEELNEQLVRDNEELNRMSDEIFTCEDAKEKLDSLAEEEKRIKEKVAVLEDTARYLQMAKDKFLGRYMGPLRKGLRQYLSLICGDEESQMLAKNFSLDMDLSVHYNYQGSTKEAEYLSAGYRDMVAFCSRLALIDALYQKEKPVVILDDPFTDLDEDKIKGALQLLRDVSISRQMIYFTCHESRLP